eukprot:CAMPEP_0204334844 /NCGR_PEP_ID=MMETSP0469-20131031/18306_1 /ASSEMBLY_ACC=CAM_ASM_000384 /TAXON_ID=2969 /ORGANISM="Oxyrrhis marina" /LENGTH=237 /DNA_ID=CAMNT_0051318401 /DNA_START=31 /DNA_END=742 /DNA_ORIENTATION=-
MSAADFHAKAVVGLHEIFETMHKDCEHIASNGRFKAKLGVPGRHKGSAEINWLRRKFEGVGFTVSVENFDSSEAGSSEDSSEDSDAVHAEFTIRWHNPTRTLAPRLRGNLKGKCAVCQEEKLLHALVPCGHSTLPIFADQSGNESANNDSDGRDRHWGERHHMQSPDTREQTLPRAGFRAAEKVCAPQRDLCACHNEEHAACMISACGADWCPSFIAVRQVQQPVSFNDRAPIGGIF